MATPAVRALRNHFSSAQLIGIMKTYVAGVFEPNPWFDAIETTGAGSRTQRLPAVIRRLRHRQIDLAVLFPNSFRSALIARLSGCRERIGYARYGRNFLLTKAIEPIRDGRGRLLPSPIIDAYNRLARAAGCPLPSRQMELFTTANDEAIADLVWRKTGLTTRPEVVCLNPGAAFGSAKCWPIEYFAELARGLAKERSCGVLVLCGPSERALARKIVDAALQPSVFSLGDHPLSLGLTKACIRRANLLVTTDSGPRHFAAAFGKPVVTLFGPTHITWTETYYPRAINLQRKVDCGPCQLRVCPLDHRCMKDLTPAEVFKYAVHLLNQNNAPAPNPIAEHSLREQDSHDAA
ncbi:MAG: glycosyltransferase family 9 protein [Gemmataceae bacterium]